MRSSFLSETEVPGRMINADTLRVIAHRYYWASKFVSGKEVLEVGCGPGLGLGYLSRHAKCVVGADIIWDSLVLAKRHYGARVEVLSIDAHRLPIKDRCIDVVVSLAAIIYLNLPVFLDECYRVLRPDGMLVINMPNKDVSGFRPSALSHKYYSVPDLCTLLGKNYCDIRLFGAFGASAGLASLGPRVLSIGRSLASKSLRPLGLYEWAKRAMGRGSLSLGEELGDKEVKSVENIQVVSLPYESPDVKHRIVYATARPR